MRWLFVVAVLAGCSKAESSQGMPAADNWNADTAAGIDPKTAKPGTKNPHGATDPSNPHAGMDPSNPHGGMDPSNPHGGMDPSNPHGGMNPGDPTSDDPMLGLGDHPPTGNGMNGPMIEKTPPRTLDKLPDGHYALGPFSVALADGWQLKPVTSSMRVADFGFGDGEMIVYYFGTGGAGSIDANLERWYGQVQQPDGKSSADVAKKETFKVGTLDAMLATVSGHFADAGMMGTAPVDIVDAELIVAIVASPQGPYYFKGFGPKKTVDANVAKFKGMLASLKVR